MVSKNKILIVDDDSNIAELISLYLANECLDTQIVGDGESALRAVKTYQPDLILLIKTECTVIGIDSDRLFPVEEQKLIASCIPGAVYHEITSKFGHDGFLL